MRPGDLDRIDPAVDERLAACHDGADERVNGVRDEADLAPLRIPPSRVGEGASGRVEVAAAQAPYVRLFVRRDGALRVLRGPLTARELRAGAELALEGRDVVRDPRRWDGEVMEEALAAGGVRVHWVENFAWSHLAGGEVHCATNALRDTSGDVPWWSTGPGR
ncbi:protein-arginine deiminase family protein [Streptomyces olindensis]|uniref:Protein-arginine deiminase family protein n=1 Tax=Streptomyces olindensis TaxID=358823 RepID=A0ABV2Y5J9_9ACTN